MQSIHLDKKSSTVLLGIFSGLIIVFLALYAKDALDNTADSKESGVVHTTKDSNQYDVVRTPQDEIKSKVISAVKKKTSDGKDKVISVQVNKAFDDPESYIVLIQINSEAAWSDDSTKKSIWSDMGDIYTALYKQPQGVRQAAIVAHMNTTDKNGKSMDSVVMKTSLEKNEAEKINWEENQPSINLRVLPETWIYDINRFQ